MIDHISYSFLHLFTGCPYAAWLKYEAMIKMPTTPWLALGNSVHNALEITHKNGPFNLKSAVDLFNKEFNRILDDEEVFISYPQKKKMEAEGTEMIGGYYEQLRAGTIPEKTLELEKEFSIAFAGTKIVGRIDKVELNESGRITIVDYKTGKKKPDQWHLRHNLQLTAYAWACQYLYGKLPEKLVWHHLRTGDLFETVRTQEDIDDLQRMIQNALAMHNLGMRHRTFNENVCGLCDYSGMPKAGGTRAAHVICDDRELEAEVAARLK